MQGETKPFRIPSQNCSLSVMRKTADSRVEVQFTTQLQTKRNSNLKDHVAAVKSPRTSQESREKMKEAIYSTQFTMALIMAQTKCICKFEKGSDRKSFSALHALTSKLELKVAIENRKFPANNFSCDLIDRQIVFLDCKSLVLQS